MAPSPLTILSDLSGLSPMAIRDIHLAKRGYKINPADGARPADSFNNVGVQVVFALLGAGMVITALWFFFWAKNGGFKWRGKEDWEDYKSTVLRRKGPDGKTLSNATKSTRLGGGSVVHGGSYGAPSSFGYSDETETTVSEMKEAEEGQGRRAFGIRGGDGEKKSKRSRRDRENNLHDPELQSYRKERSARVGGLNREADGMYTDYSATGTEPSELGSNVSSRPLVKDKEKSKSSPKDAKKEAKEKERRAKERMRQAKIAEKEAAKAAATQAKAQKVAEKEAAKKEKAEMKKAKKTKRSEYEPTPSEGPAMTEYTTPMTEYTAPMTEYTVAQSDYTASEAPDRTTRRSGPSAAYSFVTGDDDDQTVYTGVYTDNPSPPKAAAPSEPETSYYSDYRPNGRSSSRPRQSQSRRQSQSARPQGSRSRPTSESPRKTHRSSRQSTTAPPASDIFTAALGPAQGNMSYPCHIPGLSTAGSVAVSDSVSQAGYRKERKQRDVMAGYRRGEVRKVRRDSLSDSDN
ncbi:hypothetical protein DM02DRAFT_618830 [Periconia macrospinosa]|uniref:Uncharacterized protein n=1 Tax=Periconia macrospinosa TaxID=97972 RepID=A0A2V1DAE9_9PLEO|nr:hypothetical protein DM02DRAFT_618830 [Periconia macrospinosa]